MERLPSDVEDNPDEREQDKDVNHAYVNRLSAADELRRDHGQIMYALAVAMENSQTWHQIRTIAAVMQKVHHCHFRPMVDEAERMMSDGYIATGSVAPSAATPESPR